MKELCTHHSLFPEVDAYCGNELGVELVVCVSVQERGLPYARVTQRKELYQVVIIPISHSDDHNKPVENRCTLHTTSSASQKSHCMCASDQTEVIYRTHNKWKIKWSMFVQYYPHQIQHMVTLITYCIA